jgi:putative ABC transport system permease protein
MIGSSLQDLLGIGAGDTLELGNATFEVVGVFDTGTSSTTTQTGRPRFAPTYAYMLLSDAQELFDMAGEVTSVRVYAESVDEVDGVVQQITDTYGENVTVTTQESLLEDLPEVYRNVEDTVSSQLSQAESMASQEVAVSLIVGGVIVFSTMFYTVRERTKEIGILKALGFRDRDVMSQFMLEGVVISLIGGLAGVAIAAVGAPALANLLLRPISLAGEGRGGMFPGQMQLEQVQLSAPLDMGLALVGLGVAVVLGVVGSFYPALHASRQNPVEALRHE